LQLEYGESVVSAGWCHSLYSTTLNEHPTCCIPRATSLSVWWHSVALQFTGPHCSRLFYEGIWKLKFLLTPFLTLTALKMQFIRRLRMLTQDTVRHIMASVPGRWQQCLDCHGGHLQDVVLKMWGFFLWIQDTDLLNRVQLYLLLCTINVLSYFQNG
jgi:hypothetical protein